MKKAKKRRVHTYIYLSVPVSHDTWYCCTFEIKHSAARHSTAGQGTAPQGTAQRCAAPLSYCWELSCESILFVIQHIVPGTYSSSTGGVALQTMLGMKGKRIKKHAVRHSTAQHGTAPHGRAWAQGTRHGHGAGQGTAPRGAARHCAAGLLRCTMLSGAELMMMRQAKCAVHCAVCLLAMSQLWSVMRV